MKQINEQSMTRREVIIVEICFQWVGKKVRVVGNEGVLSVIW